MDVSVGRLFLLSLVVVSVVVGGVTAVRMLDVHASDIDFSTPETAETPIPANATPTEILDRGTTNLRRQSHTATIRTTAVEPEREVPPATLVSHHDPQSRTVLVTLVTPNSEPEDGVREWLIGAFYVHDALARSTETTVSASARPDQKAALSDPEWAEMRPSYRPEPAFNIAVQNVFEDYESRDGWRVLSRNDSTVVVGAENETGYAGIVGVDPAEFEATGPCSLRVFVSVKTGHITHISEQSCYRTKPTATETRIHDYGTTEVTRPPAIGFPTLDELVRDFVWY
ncbi:hypothetical protein [Haloferax sp. DFSO60]|uniref:hypothetical protein n=1 Tax=Haloferax sp. DFSO60 TaxID=3388652 RepID=UPI00397AD1C4